MLLQFLRLFPYIFFFPNCNAKSSHNSTHCPRSELLPVCNTRELMFWVSGGCILVFIFVIFKSFFFAQRITFLSVSRFFFRFVSFFFSFRLFFLCAAFRCGFHVLLFLQAFHKNENKTKREGEKMQTPLHPDLPHLG